MKLNRYYVWFVKGFESVYASSVEDACILAVATRIKEGLRTQIFMVEEEQDDGSTKWVFGSGSIQLMEE